MRSPFVLLVGPPPVHAPADGVEEHLRALGLASADASADASGDVTAGTLATALASAPPGDLALVDRRWRGHEHALRLALGDPRPRAAVGPGTLVVAADVRPALVALADGMAASDDGIPEALAERLRADGTTVTLIDAAPLVSGVARRRAEAAALDAAAAGVDEEAVRLRRAVKAHDGFFTTHFVSPYSRYVARWCARHGIRPNAVTLASLLVALGAAALFATGQRAPVVVAAVLLQASFTLDCVDGQLARYTLDFSPLGAWLDAVFDRAKEYAVYAGLAVGAAAGGDQVWGLALAAMVLQTLRHLVDLGFHVRAAAAESNRPTGRAAELSQRLDTLGWTVWLRRAIVLPIGERWAVISVVAALASARAVFVALLGLGGLAALYTVAGRVLRALPAPPSSSAAVALDALADTGPLARAVAGAAVRLVPRRLLPPPLAVALGGALVAGAGVVLAARGTATGAALVAATAAVLAAGLACARPWEGRLDWGVPAALRASEYAALAAAGAVAGGSYATAYSLVAVSAYHSYDAVYRLRAGVPKPTAALSAVGLGGDGRAAGAAALAAAGPVAFARGGALAAAGLAVVFIGESVRTWVRWSRQGTLALEGDGELE